MSGTFDLFAKIAFNEDVICEVEYDKHSKLFQMYWLKTEYQNYIDVKSSECSTTVNEWLSSLCLILGFEKITSISMMIQKPTVGDFDYFDDKGKLNIPWDGLYNYFPNHQFEINMIAT